MRELYEVGHDRLLMVASDRISVFDVVLPDEIPDKGRVLTGLSHVLVRADRATSSPNHVISCDPTDFPETAGDVAGRATLVRATRPIPLECVVRGYLFGGGWKEYADEGHGRRVRACPTGLQQAEQLPEPLFTPSTKADAGHDLPLDARAKRSRSSAPTCTSSCEDLSLALYEFGARARGDCGVILADTKFEFGELDDEIIVIDEMMTPDSSRYWPRTSTASARRRRRSTSSTSATSWTRPGGTTSRPRRACRAEVIANTRASYVEAYELITGASFDDWYRPRRRLSLRMIGDVLSRRSLVPTPVR